MELGHNSIINRPGIRFDNNSVSKNKMKHLKLSLFRLAGMVLLLTVSTFAQPKFSDPDVEYEFLVPSSDWKMIAEPSEYSRNVEYVYKDKSQAHLQIRKMTVQRDELFSEIIRDEELKLQFVPGYVAGKQENFKGALEGMVFNYEFVRSGRNMSGRSYFLKSDPVTVYLLRFTGEKGILRLTRPDTDSIARSFRLKDSKN